MFYTNALSHCNLRKQPYVSCLEMYEPRSTHSQKIQWRQRKEQAENTFLKLFSVDQSAKSFSKD